MTDAAGRPPKLLHVSIGGPILHAYFAGQLRFMRAQGFEVAVAAQGGPDLEALCRTEGVRGHPAEVVRPLRPWQDLKTLFALLRIIGRERPDIVHCHTPKGALLGLLAAFLMRVPSRIYHLRALPLETQDGAQRWLLHASELLVMRLSTGIIAISASLRERYRSFAGLRRAQVALVADGSGNGVDARARFNPERIAPVRLAECRTRLGLPAGAPALCFVGRLAVDKGLAELHAAWCQLRTRYPELRLILAGSIDERQPAPAALLDELRQDPRVCMPGFVYERELVLAAATLHVLPTWREGFGSVLIEAAAMGLPSVAFRVTGCVDAVEDGVTGTLVPARSVPDLVAAIARYLDDPALRARHAAAGRVRALERFAPERIWSELAAFYRACLRRQPGQRVGLGASQPPRSRPSSPERAATSSR